MSEPIWNKFLTERDKAVFAAGGFGARAGFGKRPALLIIDVQNYCTVNSKSQYFDRSLREIVLPNIGRLQLACRQSGIEVLYSVIENMTRNGRDRSLDYKISGIDVPRGSWEAQVVDEIVPGKDEMVFRKTSSSVFISTNIDYVLRNLGVRSLIVAGLMTDQCVESAVLPRFERSTALRHMGGNAI